MATRRRKTNTRPLKKDEEFEGHPVVKSSLSIRGAGNVFDNDLQIAPVAIESGTYQWVALGCDVADIDFKVVKDQEDARNRSHVMRAREGVLIDEDLIAEAVEQMRERRRKAEEERTGHVPMFDSDGNPVESSDKGEADGAAD